jgi:magnesium and cobalt exporter, CNNM family
MALSTIMLLSLPVLLVLSGFFSGSETALFSLSRHQRAKLEASGTFAGAVITTLLAETRSLLITLLLGNMTVNVMYFVVSTKLLLYAKEESLMGPVALGVASLAPLLAIILLGEVLPKLVATRSSDVFSRLSAVPLLAVHRAISPVRLAASILIITPLARLIAPAQRPESLTPDELGSLLELSRRQGVIDPQEQRMLRQALELGRVKIDELMTPRVDIEAFDLDNDPGELVELFKRTSLRQAPVYKKSLDHIEGFITARRALLYPPGSRLELNALIEPAMFVPQQQRSDQLLAQLRREAKTIAVVVDEYGGTAGLITLEDVAEYLVGDIAGAYDSGSEPMVEEVRSGCWRVSAELSTRDWAQVFGQSVPPDVLKTLGAVHTLGGLVMAGLGRGANVGDLTTFGNLELRVDSLDGRRIEYVTVRLTGDDEHGGAERDDGKGGHHE